MRVAIVGATGFVGGYIVDALLAAGHVPVALVRPGSERRLRHVADCSVVSGDIEDTEALATIMRGSDAAIYLPGILREAPADGITFESVQYEGAVRAMDIAREEGVTRFLLMSANGASADGTPYERTKYRAEQHLAASGLAGTVFRPSVIFGDPRGHSEFCTQLRQQMIDPPIPAPAFFRGLSPKSGSFSMSPVHVEDVAAAFVASLDDAQSHGAVYPLGGAATLRWPEIIRTIAAARGRSKLVLPTPAAGPFLACLLFDRFQWFPLTRDQLGMLLSGNTVETREAFERFGISERGFTKDELSYLAEQ